MIARVVAFISVALLMVGCSSPEKVEKGAWKLKVEYLDGTTVVYDGSYYQGGYYWRRDGGNDTTLWIPHGNIRIAIRYREGAGRNYP